MVLASLVLSISFLSLHEEKGITAKAAIAAKAIEAVERRVMMVMMGKGEKSSLYYTALNTVFTVVYYHDYGFRNRDICCGGCRGSRGIPKHLTR